MTAKPPIPTSVRVIMMVTLVGLPAAYVGFVMLLEQPLPDIGLAILLMSFSGLTIILAHLAAGLMGIDATAQRVPFARSPRIWMLGTMAAAIGLLILTWHLTQFYFAGETIAAALLLIVLAGVALALMALAAAGAIWFFRLVTGRTTGA